MSVSFATLDNNGTTTDQTTPYTTASVIPAANQPVLAAITWAIAAGTAPQPTVSGCGLTWTLVDTPIAAVRGIWLFIGIGASPTTGAISFSSGGASMQNCIWSVVQCAGVDTTTANGVVQSVTNSTTAVTSFSTNFPGTVDPLNGGFMAFGTNTSADTASALGTGWTKRFSLAETVPASILCSGDNPTVPQAMAGSYATSGNVKAVGVEMKAAVSAVNKLKAGTGGVNLAVGTSPATAAYIGTNLVWP